MIVFIEKLQNYRERIKGIDYSIMALIAQRVNLARKVGQLKSESNMPIRNYQVEKLVYDRIKGFANEFDINQEFSKDIFEQIIQQSVQAQISDIKFPEKDNNTKICLVIGGNGQMGSWFVNFLKSSGYYVEIQDPSIDSGKGKYKDLPKDLGTYDVIAICSPLRVMREVIIEVMQRKPRGLVFEISSIKNNIIDLVYQANEDNINLISVHPMYGPFVKNLAERNFIVCTTDKQDEHIKSDFKSLFKDTLANMVEVDLKEHDKYMQYSLGLSHLINLLNGVILSKSPIGFDKLIQFSGTTFRNQVINTIDIFNKNADLFHSIQNINPFRDELHQLANQSLKELLLASNEEDGLKFMKIMNIGKDYFEGVDI